MDRAWLATRLAAGRSIESIARELAKPPSTVAYWVNKYGLTSAHASRHAARGALDRERLESLIAEGLSTREIAADVGRSQATVCHWLRRYGLRTRPARYALRDEPKPAAITRECPLHGYTAFVTVGRN